MAKKAKSGTRKQKAPEVESIDLQTGVEKRLIRPTGSVRHVHLSLKVSKPKIKQ